jgi:carboxyl-terminal processing protease
MQNKDVEKMENGTEIISSENSEKNALQGGMVALNVQNQPKKQGNVKVGHVLLAVGIALVGFVGGFFTHRGMLDEEMRALIKVKTAIDKNYYTEIDNDTFYGAIFDTVNNQLLDPYSQYMSADEYAEFKKAATGKWSGIGLTFVTVDENGNEQMQITKISGNSPAERLGLLEGDKVIGFGATEESVTDSQSFAEFSLFLQDYEAGQEFVLKILSGEQTRLVTIAKEEFVENYVFYRSNTTAYTFEGAEATQLKAMDNALSALGTDTAYIRLTQFNGNADKEFDKAMSQFKADGKKNLVLDLRGNGGGYLDIAQEIAKYFCKTATQNKPIIAVANYGEYNEKFKAKGNEYYEYFSNDSKICVLADSSSASASECLLGCMLDYGTISYGDICLSFRDGVAKTYGKGIMQTTYPLGLVNSDAVKLTTAKICWPLSGTCIHDRGILPADGTKTVEESQEKDVEIINALNVLFS